MLDLLSYVIVPLYTLLFSGEHNLLTSNFSVIGNMLGQKEGFLLWGFLLALCLVIILSRTSENLDLPAPKRHLVLAALAALFLSITTPYLPEEFPFKSFMHVLLAALSAFFLILYLLFASIALYRLHPPAGATALTVLGTILIGSLLLLIHAGIISSALEIFFSISAIFLGRFLLWQSRLPHCRKKGR